MPSSKNGEDLTYVSEVIFVVPGSCPADSSRHKVLFLRYFCPRWLSNRNRNNVLAVIFDGFSTMTLPGCLAIGLFFVFFKVASKSFFSSDELSKESQASKLCLAVHQTSSGNGKRVIQRKFDVARF